MKPIVDFDIRLIFAILNGKVSSAISCKLLHNFHAAGIDLTPDQWNVLQHLSQRDGVSQQDLCDAMYLDKPRMVRLINSMTFQCLVTRTQNRFDRRKNIIRLTEKGIETHKAAIPVALLTLKEALRGLNLSDIRTTQSVLRSVFENTTGLKSGDSMREPQYALP